MTVRQYEALVRLKEEAQKKAWEICGNFRVFIDVNVHEVDVDAEVWENQKVKELTKRADGTEYYTNGSFTKISLFSKELKN